MKKLLILNLILFPNLLFSQNANKQKCIDWPSISPTEKEIYFIDEICRSGDLKAIKLAVKKGISINALSQSDCALTTVGYNIAGRFAQGDETNKSIKLIEEFLKMGANPNIQSCPPNNSYGPPMGLNADNIFSYYIESYSESNFDKIWPLLLKYKGNPDFFASEILKSACASLNFGIINKIIGKADIKKYHYLKHLKNAHLKLEKYNDLKRINESEYLKIYSLLISKGAYPLDSDFQEPISYPIPLESMRLDR